MVFEMIRLELAEGVATIVLNRPERLNAGPRRCSMR